MRIRVAFSAREDADQGDFSLPADTLKRARERPDAAIFDHAIDAASFGEREHFFFPIGMRLVIHAAECAEAASALDFRVAG